MPQNVDIVARLCEKNPNAEYLAQLLAASEPAYAKFLDLVRSEIQEGPFAPWDIQYVDQRLLTVIEDLYASCSSAILKSPFETIQTLLGGLGFVDESKGLRWSSPGELPHFYPGLTIVFGRNKNKPSSGKTFDNSTLFPEKGLGSALCAINSATDTYTDVLTLLRELGRALFFVTIQTKYNLLRRSIKKVFCEGVARVFEDFAIDARFMELAVGGIPESERLTVLTSAREIFVFQESLAIAIAELFCHEEGISIYDMPSSFASETLFPRLEQDVGPELFAVRAQERYRCSGFTAIETVHYFIIRAHISEQLRIRNQGRLFTQGFAEDIRPLFEVSPMYEWQEALKVAGLGDLDFMLSVTRQERGIRGWQ